MLKYLKYKKYEKGISKKTDKILKIFNSKTTSEFFEIVYTQEEIKNDIEEILSFFDLVGEYGIAYFDKSYKPTLENVGFMTKKFNKKGNKQVLNRIDKLIKLNYKLIQEDKLKIDLSSEKDVDIIFDFLTNPKYGFLSKDLENLVNAISRNIDKNIKSPYLIEIVDLILQHKRFIPKIIENLFNKRIAGKDLDFSYFKAIFIILLGDKIKDYINIYDRMNLLIIDKAINSNIFDNSFKIKLVETLKDNQEIHKDFQKRLNTNKTK